MDERKAARESGGGGHKRDEGEGLDTGRRGRQREREREREKRQKCGERLRERYGKMSEKTLPLARCVPFR